MHKLSSVPVLLGIVLFALIFSPPPPVHGFQYIHFWNYNASGILIVAGNHSYPAESYRFWNYYDNSSSQTCKQIMQNITLNNVSVEFIRQTADIDGNLLLEYNLTTPLQPADVLLWQEEWVFEVLDHRFDPPQISKEQSGNVSEISESLGGLQYGWYTRATSLWKTNNDTLIDLAGLIRSELAEEEQDNALALVYGAMAWIDANIHNPITIIEPQYPEELLVSEIGDCDDRSNLLIVLLRLFGIPCYLMTGHWYQEGAITADFLWGSIAEEAYLYVNWQNGMGHAWVMAYIPPWGWLPFDLLSGYIAAEPSSAVYNSLYARNVPLVTLWICNGSDYIGERRAAQQDLFNYSLQRMEYEFWEFLGSVPILDPLYFSANTITIIALIATVSVLSCLIGIGMRRQPTQEETSS
ncbi:MAG: transglutaminase family protein [Promethearchaeota archaeon]